MKNKHLLTDKEVKEVCKPGSPDCCRFLVCGAKGFECAKLTELRNTLDFRANIGQMTARGDNCEGK
jgi:hypothetical protein